MAPNRLRGAGRSRPCLRALDDLGGGEAEFGIDIGCAVRDGGFAVTRDKSNPRDMTIEQRVAGVALISFVMRLLQLPQTVGSAPAIDYDAYLRSVPGT